MTESINRPPITHIAQGTHITADIETSSIIKVSGRVEGDITTESELVLEVNGHVTGTVICKKATINGKLTGELRATENLEVQHTANIDGFVFTKRIQVEDGAILIGIINAGPKVDVLKAKISGKKAVQQKAQPKRTEPATHTPTSDKPKTTAVKNEPSEEEKPPRKPVNRYLHKLLIGIPHVEESNEQTEAIYKASEQFFTALGFSLEIFDTPSYAPLYQNLSYVRKGPEDEHEVSKDFRKGKELIETAFLKKEPDEDATQLQQSTVTITNLIGQFDELAMLLGEVLIIKFQQNDVQTIAVEIATEQVRNKLSKDPKLITDPEKVYALL